MALDRVATVGVYGFTPDQFFQAIAESQTDLFCDIRARRGVRGRDYAFANANRLMARLSELGIEYRHFPELAPTQEIRALQHAADRSAGVAKRSRDELSPAFVQAYEGLLDQPEARQALDAIRATSRSPLLLCVERLPSACHRSLVAGRLAGGATAIQHLLP
jgi:uncharacterized protein (DUF488 family)